MPAMLAWWILGSALAVDVRDAVVMVVQGDATCAGTLIDDRGTLLTAYHCVATGGRPRVVTRDGARVIGRTVAVDPKRDLAVVRTALAGRSFLVVRDEAPRPDEPIRVVGHPHGASEPAGFFEGLLRWSVAGGTVSAVGARAFQLSAPVNPGNSGGPVLDDQDRVIGVVSSKIRGADGLGFAGRAVPLPSRPPRLWGGVVEAGVVIQVPAAVGAQLGVVVRDRVLLQGTASAPIGMRWDAFTAGEAHHWPWEIQIGLRQRVFRGSATMRFDLLGGAASWTTVRYDEGRFRYASSVVPTVAFRFRSRGLGISYGVSPSAPGWGLLRLELNAPGTVLVF